MGIYKFIYFYIRRQIDEKPDLDWHNVQELLDMMSLREIERSVMRNPDEAFEMVKRYRDKTFKTEDVQTSTIVTVEDLNSMLMFLQKLRYDKLHLVIEYTQLLLDYLMLPTSSNWREEVMVRWESETAHPFYYKNIERLRTRVKADEKKFAGKMDDEPAIKQHKLSKAAQVVVDEMQDVAAQIEEVVKNPDYREDSFESVSSLDSFV